MKDLDLRDYLRIYHNNQPERILNLHNVKIFDAAFSRQIFINENTIFHYQTQILFNKLRGSYEER